MEEFDYLNSNVSKDFEDSLGDRSSHMFEREIKERAQLLHNLHYPKDQTILRIRHNLAWEFDDAWTRKEPKMVAMVETIVYDVYKRLADKRD